MDEITLELIKLVPSLLWFLLVLIVLLVFYRPIRDDLLPSLTGFSAAGVELSFVRESIDLGQRQGPGRQPSTKAPGGPSRSTDPMGGRQSRKQSE